MPRSPALHYRVEVANPAAHLFRVTLTIPDPAPEGETLSLPVWIPGSYMIREFAKNIVRLEARQGGKAVALRQQDKHRWRTGALAPDLAVEVTAEIYGWDLSVRCAHVDTTHAFFNGTQLFLAVEGHQEAPHVVTLERPQGEDYAAWQVATTLPTARRHAGAARQGGFGLYRAESYDALIDHPVEMGRFASLRFTAGGVPHHVAVTGRVRFDTGRLARDLSRICQWHIDLFGGTPPFKRYLFQVMAVGEGYGGLEHRDSTALICSRNDLPAPGATGMDERYRTFLGLASHEYFHAWNVKRIQPAAFRPYRLDAENYTRLLWVFEGFTSYYDDLALVRTGIVSPPEYLAMLAKTIGNVERYSGREKQSVADSSFNAWTKYYRQDENSPNAIVSYYTKGSLVAAGLDLFIRQATRGRRSLDDVMRWLWNNVALAGRGLEEDEVPALIKAATGVNVSAEIAAWAEGTQDVPLAELLAPFGIALTRRRGSIASGLGAKTRTEGVALKLAQVFDGGSLQQAGVSAGDELVALDGLRVTPGNLDGLLSRYKVGERFTLDVFRRDELMRFAVTLAAPRLEECSVTIREKSPAPARRLREGWLGNVLPSA